MIAHWLGKSGWLSGEVKEINREQRVIMPDGIHSFSLEELRTSESFYLTDNKLTTR